MQSPYREYPQGHQDVLSSLLQNNMAQNDMEAAKRQSAMGEQAKQFANQYQLQAMQNQMASQEQVNNLAQQRMNNVLGPTSNILQGLFN
jgi:hypothetical protein